MTINAYDCYGESLPFIYVPFLTATCHRTIPGDQYLRPTRRITCFMLHSPAALRFLVTIKANDCFDELLTYIFMSSGRVGVAWLARSSFLHGGEHQDTKQLNNRIPIGAVTRTVPPLLVCVFPVFTGTCRHLEQHISR